MNRVEEWVLQNKGNIEKGVEIMGQTCEVLAATVGQLHPILEAVFVGCAELLKNPQGTEAKYLATQFQKVNEKLATIQNEFDLIDLERQRASMHKQNFDREAQMVSQYEKFLEFVNAEPKYKDKKKDKFLSHFENTEGDLNLEALYSQVTGENSSEVELIKQKVIIEQKSRRPVEEFCARLKKLFMMGIIAVVGYTALKKGIVRKDLLKTWQDRLEDVERRMKAAVDDCTENFASQAQEDIKCHLQAKQGIIDQNITQSLLELLKKKYDWVVWSLLVLNHQELFFLNWWAGKNYQGHCGGGNFFSLTENKREVVVSFSADPKPINKSQVLKQIETQKQTSNMVDVADTLSKHLPNCLVHAISRFKEVVECNNFPKECYYYDIHGKTNLCIIQNSF